MKQEYGRIKTSRKNSEKRTEYQLNYYQQIGDGTKYKIHYAR